MSLLVAMRSLFRLVFTSDHLTSDAAATVAKAARNNGGGRARSCSGSGGAGPAGLVAAGRARRNGKAVALRPGGNKGEFGAGPIGGGLRQRRQALRGRAGIPWWAAEYLIAILAATEAHFCKQWFSASTALPALRLPCCRPALPCSASAASRASYPPSPCRPSSCLLAAAR